MLKPISEKTPPAIKCPHCDLPLLKKSGKWGTFYGCPNYARKPNRCYYTMDAEVYDLRLERLGDKTAFTPTEEQAAIYKWFVDGEGNLIIEACAGSGKTRTLEETDDYIPQRAKVIYLVFNVKNEKEAQAKMPLRYDVLTTHKFAKRAWEQYLRTRGLAKKVWVDNRKLHKIVSNLITDWKEQGWLATPTRKIIDLLKGRLEEPTIRTIKNIIEIYGEDQLFLPVSDNGDSAYDMPTLVQFITQVYQLSLADKRTIDFSDMLFFPIYYNAPIPQYDFVLCDEVQDFTACQIELVRRAGGRIVGVGDRNQSIYGFRGAMLDAMDQFKRLLNAEEKTLSMSWRVPKVGGEIVNDQFPHILFNVPSTAKEGSIQQMDADEALRHLEDGWMVLCRINAPLVRPVYKLLKQGRKAYIVGRDIGHTLVELIEQHNSPYIEEMLAKLTNYRDMEVRKLLAQEKELAADLLMDRVETIFALSEGCATTDELKTKIDQIFSDDSEGIAFSSIHKAKGLEAENVVILKRSLIPHRLARQPWEIQQETNMAYVAYTRFKNRLIVCK